jgi:hypothetical protein
MRKNAFKKNGFGSIWEVPTTRGVHTRLDQILKFPPTNKTSCCSGFSAGLVAADPGSILTTPPTPIVFLHGCVVSDDTDVHASLFVCD